MSLAGALVAGQAAAEARMLDTFEIRTLTGSTHYDPATDAEVDDFAVLFTTPGRVKVSGGLAEHDTEVGGRTSATVTRTLHIPVTSPAVPTNAVAVCTAVDATTDPTLLNARLRLSGPAPGSQTTARRLQVEEVLT